MQGIYYKANRKKMSQLFFQLETHRTVLNQILRQTSSTLAEGPFAVLVNHTRLLDFDIKRRHFRQELDKQDKVSLYSQSVKP